MKSINVPLNDKPLCKTVNFATLSLLDMLAIEAGVGFQEMMVLQSGLIHGMENRTNVARS